MKCVHELKSGDTMYDVIGEGTIVRYEYLCVHPKSNKYHILINSNSEPIRMYERKVNVILNKNLNNYQEAIEYAIKNLKTIIEMLEQED